MIILKPIKISWAAIISYIFGEFDSRSGWGAYIPAMQLFLEGVHDGFHEEKHYDTPVMCLK